MSGEPPLSPGHTAVNAAEMSASLGQTGNPQDKSLNCGVYYTGVRAGRERKWEKGVMESRADTAVLYVGQSWSPKQDDI